MKRGYSTAAEAAATVIALGSVRRSGGFELSTFFVVLLSWLGSTRCFTLIGARRVNRDACR